MTSSALRAHDVSKTVYGFDHVGLTVSDIDAALKFWSVVLQVEAPPVMWEGTRKYLDEHVGYTDVYVKAAWIDLPHGQLELLEYLNPKPGKVDPETYNAGHMHFCFAVPDLEAEFQRLKAADIGIEFRSDRVVVIPDDDPDFPGYKCLYFRTPDGATIELVQSGY